MSLDKILLDVGHGDLVLREYLRELLGKFVLTMVESQEEILHLIRRSIVELNVIVSSSATQKGRV